MNSELKVAVIELAVMVCLVGVTVWYAWHTSRQADAAEKAAKAAQSSAEAAERSLKVMLARERAEMAEILHQLKSKLSVCISKTQQLMDDGLARRFKEHEGPGLHESELEAARQMAIRLRDLSSGSTAMEAISKANEVRMKWGGARAQWDADGGGDLVRKVEELLEETHKLFLESRNWVDDDLKTISIEETGGDE